MSTSGMDGARGLVPGTEAELLVLADVMSVLWGPLVTEQEAQQPWKRHERFLRHLLGAPERPDETPPDDDARGPSLDGWLLPQPALRQAEKELADARGPVAEKAHRQVADFRRRFPDHLEPVDDDETTRGPWLTGTDGGLALDRAVRGLQACGRLCDLPDEGDAALLGALLNLYACRLYVSGEQVRRLTGADRDLLPHACLDLRFRSRLRRFWLVATLSLWTAPPASLRHAPAERADTRWTSTSDVREAMRAARDTFEKQLQDAFTPLRMSVFAGSNLPYPPPRFWVVRGDDMVGVRRRADQGAVENASRALLQASPSASTTAAGVIEQWPSGSQLYVLRRYVPDPGVPRYVVVPQRPEAGAEQEEAVRRFIYGMSDIEGRAAADLYDVSTDANTRGALADSYQYVADTGNRLWDQLSMEFPTARGSQLTKIHRQVDLIHQVLLQGVADLEEVRTEAARLTATFEDTVAALVDDFDREFTEVPVPDRQPLRSSVSQSGYVATTKGVVDDTCGRAQRAREAYEGILHSVTLAFDERRVRVTDNISLWALAVALGLAVAPVFVEVWGAIAGRWEGAGPTVFVWAGVGVAVVAGLFLWHRLRTLGGLELSGDFRTRYEALRRYLTDCRTEPLERALQRSRSVARARGLAGPRPTVSTWEQHHADWRACDRGLARRFAEQVDAIRAFPGTGVSEERRSGLRTRIERWALVSLLATERPRTFFGYPLPLLTLLYRTYPLWDALTGARDDDGPSLVADADLMLTLRVTCRAHPEEVESVDRWLHALRVEARREGEAQAAGGSRGADARAVLQAIADTGIHVGMDRAEWKDALRLMRESLDADSITGHLAAHSRDPERRAAAPAPGSRPSGGPSGQSENQGQRPAPGDGDGAAPRTTRSTAGGPGPG
ncbi:hypothetical protein [Geodermatophilus sp. CPCC 205506]|uniref:hypothetical protein n=1 Tax=Geodermatophilus sp. CPCC 205506 TaxID=2936596 RepID=UPI003EEE8782